jgi:hypothetical protein
VNRSSARLVGVDVARCLALLGMMATHILPGVRDGEVTTIQQLAGGRASALFAVLAGVSLVLVAGTRRPLLGRAWLGMQAGTLVRALLIGGIGLWLGSLETNIAVILVYYAVLFVVGAPFLALPTKWLAVAAAASVVAGPALSFVLRRDLPPSSYAVPSPESLSDPVALLRELLLTGYYPVATWLPYLLVGLLLGRLDLRSTRVAVHVALAGALAMAVAVLVSDTYLERPGVRRELIRSYDVPGWQGDLDTSLTHGLYGVVPTETWSWLMVRAPHSGAWFDLVMTIGSAALVIGVCLLVGRAAPRVLAVVFGAGAMTLTLYTLHVWLRQEGRWDGNQLSDYLGQVALVLAVGAGVRMAGRRGPLEFLVGKASSVTRTAVGGSRAPSRQPSGQQSAEESAEQSGAVGRSG